MIDVKKLISQLSNATVVVERLPSIKGHLRLVTACVNKENNNNVADDKDDEFFFQEPGKKKASKVSKPFCSKCNITVENYKKTEKNCRTCGTLLLFKCMTCRTQYTSLHGIRNHLKTKCDETTPYIQCSMCDYVTNFKNALYQHIKYVHDSVSSEFFEEFNPDKTADCPFCHKKFKYQCNLASHLRGCKSKQSEHLPDLKNTLKSCENKLISDKTNLLGYSVKYHVKTKFSETQTQLKHFCPKCNKMKKNTSKFQSKCNTCRSFLTFICKKCNKQYQNSESMRYHLESKCSPKAIYQCSKCSYKSTVKISIKKHIKNMHLAPRNAQQPKSDCSKCGAQLTRDTVKSHLKCCTATPTFFCKQCPYSTKYRSNLKSHRKNNHAEFDEKNFNDHARKLPIQKSSDDLSNHKSKKAVSIDGIVDNISACCTACKQETDASKHIDKKCRNCGLTIFYKCKNCSKLFSYVFYAKAHVTTCLAVRLMCKYCSRKLDNYHQFKKHLHFCDAKAQYTCQHCFYRGKSKSDMLVHEKRCDRSRSVEKTSAFESVENIQNDKSKAEDKVVTSKETQDENGAIAFRVKGIDILRKQIVDRIPMVHEMTSRHCPKCKKVYESKFAMKNVCSLCENTELYYQCLKCEKQYQHRGSLVHHLQSSCFRSVQYTCSICNYVNYVKSDIVRHAKVSKHTIPKS